MAAGTVESSMAICRLLQVWTLDADMVVDMQDNTACDVI
jgi:hypothetical protein